MQYQDWIKIQKDILDMQNCLIELVKECILEIFKDDPYKNPSSYVYQFENDLDCFVSNGCLQSLLSYKNHFKERIERFEKQKEEN